jgi:hypothetical protein
VIGELMLLDAPYEPARMPAIESDESPPVKLMAAPFFAAVGYHVRTSICTVSELIERRFAEFADLPYQNPITREQWEQLWESERKWPSHLETTGQINSGGERGARRSP